MSISRFLVLLFLLCGCRGGSVVVLRYMYSGGCRGESFQATITAEGQGTRQVVLMPQSMEPPLLALRLPSGVVGEVTVELTARDGRGCTVARGQAKIQVNPLLDPENEANDVQIQLVCLSSAQCDPLNADERPIPERPEVLWAVRCGSPGDDFALSTAIDSEGNVLVSGTFARSDLDMRCVSTRTDGNFVIKNRGGSFVAKFSRQGQLLWSRNLGGLNDKDEAEFLWPKIAIDSDGSIYVIGNIDGTPSLVKDDDGNLFKPRESGTILAVKYSSSGILYEESPLIVPSALKASLRFHQFAYREIEPNNKQIVIGGNCSNYSIEYGGEVGDVKCLDADAIFLMRIKSLAHRLTVERVRSYAGRSTCCQLLGVSIGNNGELYWMGSSNKPVTSYIIRAKSSMNLTTEWSQNITGVPPDYLQPGPIVPFPLAMRRDDDSIFGYHIISSTFTVRTSLLSRQDKLGSIYNDSVKKYTADKENWTTPVDIDIDVDNNMIVTGFFVGNISLEGMSLASGSSRFRDIFLIIYGTDGSYRWHGQYGTSTGDDRPWATALSPQGDVATVGQTDSEQIEFVPGKPLPRIGNSGTDLFILSLGERR